LPQNAWVLLPTGPSQSKLADLAVGAKQADPKRIKGHKMSKIPNQTENISLRQAWQALRKEVLNKTGAISIRTAGEGCSGTVDAQGLYGEDLDLSLDGLKIVAKLTEPLVKNICIEADCLTIAEDYILITTTDYCIENDQELHRRIERDGVIMETEDGFCSSERFGSDLQMEDNQKTFMRDPIKVIIHGKDEASIFDMEYAGSFDVSPARLPESLAASEVIVFEEGEENGRLVCDFHQGPKGLRCFTITRDAMTPEGATRRVIYSDMRI
jgi:hypothetical protein